MGNLLHVGRCLNLGRMHCIVSPVMTFLEPYLEHIYARDKGIQSCSSRRGFSVADLAQEGAQSTCLQGSSCSHAGWLHGQKSTRRQARGCTSKAALRYHWLMSQTIATRSAALTGAKRVSALTSGAESTRARSHARWWNPSASTKNLALLFASWIALVRRSMEKAALSSVAEGPAYK